MINSVSLSFGALAERAIGVFGGGSSLMVLALVSDLFRTPKDAVTICSAPQPVASVPHR